METQTNTRTTKASNDPIPCPGCGYHDTRLELSKCDCSQCFECGGWYHCTICNVCPRCAGVHGTFELAAVKS